MSKRALFLFLLTLVGAGYAIHKHWAEIRVFLRFDSSGENEAISITRKARSMSRAQTNNEIALSRTSIADIERVGWRAEKKSEAVFVVRYEYREAGETRAIYFLADIEQDRVSNIDGEDARLKYGLPAPR